MYVCMYTFVYPNIRALVRLSRQDMAAAAEYRLFQEKKHDSPSQMGPGPGGADTSPVGLVVRTWQPHMDPGMEFRCWIFEGKLTAITQYTPFLFVPGLVTYRDAVCDLIVDFFRDKIEPRLATLNEKVSE